MFAHIAFTTYMTQKRPPIVVVMGHVDHGKTTLLDHIRKTNVAGREAGGITQSIGAYEILHGDKKITFIDTPGHEAFGKMRGHGARVADLAILVVAADDGVKPQTREALAAINAAKLSYVVAINKTDTSGANVEKTKKDLANAGVYLEGFGGDVSWHAISAKTGEGVNGLLDLILLATDIQNLTYDPAAPAGGVILGTRLDPRRGLLVSAVIKNGTLRGGDTAGTASARGKVKMLENYLGKTAKTLAPSAPALIVGFESSPAIGEEFIAGPTAMAEPLLAELRKNACAAEAPFNPETGPGETLNVILKADEAGSLEALADLLPRIPTVKPVRIIQQSIGQVYENDVKLAASSGALIVGFRTKVDRAAENLAEAHRVLILSSPIIYHLEEALKKHAGSGTAARTLQILALFGAPKGRERVVGGRVTAGPVKNQEPFSIIRNGETVGEGKILNLQSNKIDIAEAKEGQEAGLLVESETPIAVGDVLSFSDFARTE